MTRVPGTGLRALVTAFLSCFLAASPFDASAVDTASPGQLQMPGTVMFGAQAVGTRSAGIPVTLTNIGATPVTLSSVVSSAPGEFMMTSRRARRSARAPAA